MNICHKHPTAAYAPYCAECEIERLRADNIRLAKQRDACVAAKYEARATLRALIEAFAPIVEHMERNASVDWSLLDRVTVSRAMSAYYAAIARVENSEAAQ